MIQNRKVGLIWIFEGEITGARDKHRLLKVDEISKWDNCLLRGWTGRFPYVAVKNHVSI